MASKAAAPPAEPFDGANLLVEASQLQKNVELERELQAANTEITRLLELNERLQSHILELTGERLEIESDDDDNNNDDASVEVVEDKGKRGGSHRVRFEEKCQLLREYRQEFGNLDIPQTLKPPPKYASLPRFVKRLKEQYRHFLDGKQSSLTGDRLETLQSIGLSLESRGESYWNKNYEILVSLKNKYGHCCIPAIADSAQIDSNLYQWVLQQRRNLKLLGNTPPKQQAKKRRTIPLYFTEAKYDLLRSLNCDWLNSFEDTEPAKRYSLNGVAWYKFVEHFREYVKQHGNGFVNTTSESGIGKWVRDQRTLYDAVQSEQVPTCPTFESNFRLLQSIGFVFDHTLLDQERQRREQSSTSKQLELARSNYEKARRHVKEVEKMRRLEVFRARSNLRLAETCLKEAREANKTDPSGKKVMVKPRGGNHQSGLAIVLDVRTTIVAGNDLNFYDVEFCSNGKKAMFVDGAFIELLDDDKAIQEAEAAVVEEEKTNEEEDTIAVAVAGAEEALAEKAEQVVEEVEGGKAEMREPEPAKETASPRRSKRGRDASAVLPPKKVRKGAHVVGV